MLVCAECTSLDLNRKHSISGGRGELEMGGARGEEEVGGAGKHISHLVAWLDHDRWLLIRTGI